MKIERYDLIVIGAGPAGLSAAIEAAKTGVKPIVFDENARPGGQLFKQIHKFFGSKEHKAKIRGFRIGEELLLEAEKYGVRVVLNAAVIGLFTGKEVLVKIDNEVKHYKGDAVLVATGAAENMVNFPGWTLPGVIGAGAAQTLMNLHHIMPGNRVLMLGTGNVGLVVAFQLLQAGCEVVAFAEAASHIGGYGVHASKVARCKVPFYLSHTIKEVEGETEVTGVTIAQIDSQFHFIEGTEKHFDVDTVCVAVGLSPMAQLLKMCGAKMNEARGIPECDESGATSIPGVYAAGDVAGIEEASSAMIEGRISGMAIAAYLGYISEEKAEKSIAEHQQALGSLRKGMFAPENRGKIPEYTEEGIPVSVNLLGKGFLADDEIARYPGVICKAGVHPVLECTQNIPCNPCQDACKAGCISIGEHISSLPVVVEESKCTNCGMCVASCPGQAIFLVEENVEDGFAAITIPYEFLPLPKAGDMGIGLGRDGHAIAEAEVIRVRSMKAYDHTNLLTIKVPEEHLNTVRFFRPMS